MKKQIKDIYGWDDWEWLTANCDWILPQALAKIAELPLVRSGDKVAFKTTLERWGDTGLNLGDRVLDRKEFKSLLGWIHQAPRGRVLGSGRTQTHESWLSYSAPVPLVLSAFKRYRNLGYESWDWADPYHRYFLDPDLTECVPWFHQNLDFETDQLLAWRTEALTVKSGKTAGATRRPQSTAVAFNIKDPEFLELPRLVRLLVLQLWCYMPQFYNPYMIVNLSNLDQPQAPLVDSDILPTVNTDQMPTLDEIWK